MVSVKKSNRKRIRIIIATVILAFFVVSMTATKLVYDRVFARYDAPADIPAALSEMVERRQICQFPSGENLLTGYYYGTDTAVAHGLVVLSPGFHAGGDDYLPLINSLTEYGWGVFTFDSTGTLRSEGESQIGFAQAIPDLEAALNYVEKNGKFGYNELVLIGHSRGAYAACCALNQTRDVAAVVSVSGVNSAMEAIMEMSVKSIGPISYGNYGFLWLYQVLLFGANTVNLQACQAISGENVPVLVVHGRQDETFSTDAGAIVAYREEIPSSNVEYLLCDAGHTDILYDADGTANDALVAQIHDFLIRSIEK